AVVVGLWFARGRIGRGPLAAVLIFAGVLTPALGFFDVFPFRYSFVADHFQYHASLALVTLAVAGGATLLSKFSVPMRLQMTLAVLLVLVLGVMSDARTHVYHDLMTLYTDTLERNPQSAAAHNNLGNYLRQQGQPAESLAHLQAAVRLEAGR